MFEWECDRVCASLFYICSGSAVCIEFNYISHLKCNSFKSHLLTPYRIIETQSHNKFQLIFSHLTSTHHKYWATNAWNPILFAISLFHTNEYRANRLKNTRLIRYFPFVFQSNYLAMCSWPFDFDDFSFLFFCLSLILRLDILIQSFLVYVMFLCVSECVFDEDMRST